MSDGHTVAARQVERLATSSLTQTKPVIIFSIRGKRMPPDERLGQIAIEDEMRSSYLDYAMSVIVGRALPDVRDGLKPVHRRILHGMNEMGLASNRAYRKSAKIVGEIMGNYHPHGDSRDLRHARSHGATLQHALYARGRPGQLWIGRRRSAGGHAVYRSPPDQARRGHARRYRQGNGRFRAELRRVAGRTAGAPLQNPESPRSTAPAALRWAMPPTFRPTISAK